MLSPFDGYRDRRLRPFAGQASLRPALVTNGTFTRRTRKEARARYLQLLDGAELLRRLDDTPCTAAEVESTAARRLASMRDVQAAIDMAG
jgi:hypothetical protein